MKTDNIRGGQSLTVRSCGGPRGVRGFAVTFYAKEGNRDRVGNNILRERLVQAVERLPGRARILRITGVVQESFAAARLSREAGPFPA